SAAALQRRPPLDLSPSFPSPPAHTAKTFAASLPPTAAPLHPHSFPTRRSSDLNRMRLHAVAQQTPGLRLVPDNFYGVEQAVIVRSEEHTSELQSLAYLVCRLLLEKKNASPPSDESRFQRLSSSSCVSHVATIEK